MKFFVRPTRSPQLIFPKTMGGGGGPKFVYIEMANKVLIFAQLSLLAKAYNVLKRG